MGFIKSVAGNFIPTLANIGAPSQIVDDAARSVLSAVYPNQYESFEITLQLVQQGAGSAVIPIKSLSFPVMPESLMMAQKYLLNVTPTLGGVFVDDFGRAPSPIVLQGTFGKRIRGIVGSGLTNNNLATGYGMAKNLSDFVEESHKVAENGKLPIVLFYNWAFNSHWEVVIAGFDVQMSTQQNGLWLYQLQLITLKQLEKSFLQSVTDRVTDSVVSGLAGGAAGRVVANITLAVSAINSVKNVLAAANLLGRSK